MMDNELSEATMAAAKELCGGMSLPNLSAGIVAAIRGTAIVIDRHIRPEIEQLNKLLEQHGYYTTEHLMVSRYLDGPERVWQIVRHGGQVLRPFCSAIEAIRMADRIEVSGRASSGRWFFSIEQANRELAMT